MEQTLDITGSAGAAGGVGIPVPNWLLYSVLTRKSLRGLHLYLVVRFCKSYVNRTLTTMPLCVNCSRAIKADVHYFLRDLGPEILNILQNQIELELVPEDGELCDNCFRQVVHDLSVQDRTEEVSAHFDAVSNHPLPPETNVCVWCRSSLYQRRSHSMRGSVRNFVRDTIYPREIPAGGLLCFGCWVYAHRILQRENVAEATVSPEPAENVQNEQIDTNQCVWCLASLASRRRHSLPEGPERNEIAARIHPRLIPPEGRVCYACWVSARRNVQRQIDGIPDVPEPSYRRHHMDRCAWCQTSLHRRWTNRLLQDAERNIVISNIHPRELSGNPLICRECWNRIQIRLNEAEVPEILEDLDTVMELNYRKTPHTSRCCFVPGCSNSERLVVPKYLRKQILKEKNVYVTPNSRICSIHKSNYNWDILDQDDFGNTFSKNEIQDMLNLATEEVNMFLNFENVEMMDEGLLKYWTGVTLPQFNVILESVPILNDNCKFPKTALGLYLMKCRTGDSHERIASLLQISKAKVCRLLQSAREALLCQFVPLHLGVNHTNREDFINRNLLIPEGLFGDREDRKVMIIMDGTYVYVQKSSNYYFQKKTYSLHKYRNLVKPFLIVATDGHILDIFGPYPATTSDADITKALFQNENELRSFFREGDVFILDRGFRDAIPYLEDQQFRVYKPESLEEGERQLPFDKANRSRCVTLCRWVVEVVNGRFKRDYKLFRQEYFNCAATHLMVDFRICGALVNAFHREICDRPDAQLILNRALERLHRPNTLGTLIVAGNINRHRAGFMRIDGDLPELEIFPQMDQADLILFALGTYQIKQACSYYGEHIRNNGSFEVEVCEQLERINMGSSNAKLLRGRISSRHSSNRIYYTYVLLTPQEIIEWYCSCICGMRTVGCCAHVMTIIWYLGWARHQDSVTAPASFLDGILCREDYDDIDE